VEAITLGIESTRQFRHDAGNTRTLGLRRAQNVQNLVRHPFSRLRGALTKRAA
jgi:hypothetical protein